MSDAHSINIEQNKPKRLELLRAQRLYYARAKRYMGCFTFAAVLLPIVAALVGPHVEAIRPYLGLASLVLLLLEVGYFLPLQRQNCKNAAKIQEQFDTEVLRLDWNKLVAGRKVEAEEIRAIASTPLAEDEKRKLEGWYETPISRLPLPVGRLLCQRTNIVYDSRVRTWYARTLLWVAALVVLALTLVGVHQSLKLDEVILTLALPVTPLLTYLLREWRKQADSLEGLESLKAEALKLWDDALDGAPFLKLTISARALQDAIYRHRTSNPLVFDWYYDWLRDGNERLTSQAIESLVSEAEVQLRLREAL